MNDKKPPAPRSPRQLPETLKGAAHRDRRNAKSRLLEEPRTLAAAERAAGQVAKQERRELTMARATRPKAPYPGLPWRV